MAVNYGPGCQAVPADGSFVLPSAARTTTQSVDLKNNSGSGVEVIVDVSVNAGGAGSITMNIRAKDPISGNYVTILASAAIVAVGTTRYRVHPGIAVVGNATASDTVPHDWNVQVVANNANPMTYSVSASAFS